VDQKLSRILRVENGLKMDFTEIKKFEGNSKSRQINYFNDLSDLVLYSSKSISWLVSNAKIFNSFYTRRYE